MNIFQQKTLEFIDPDAKDYKSLTDEEKQFYKDIVMTLKIALFGDPNNPLPIWESMAIIGKRKVISRLNHLGKLKAAFDKKNEIA